MSQRANRRTGIVSQLTKPDAGRITPPLEWYRLTENSRNVLNAIITLAAREERVEKKRSQPDIKRIDYLKALYAEAYSVSRTSSNFESLDKMRDIVRHYEGVLQSLTPVR
ncbi:MAG TPA: hypothetical protein VK668_16320 [Mucilaginibacter sp.]|nr:hypothetical protein [Mucilaginibacter sp.]